MCIARRAAAAVFFNSIAVARGAPLQESSLMVVGGGGLSSAVVGHVASTSTFWWYAWLAFLHIMLLAVAVYTILKVTRAARAYFKEGKLVRGGGSLTPAVMDQGTQCEIVHLAGLTVEGLQEECRRAGLRTNGLRAELVARVDNELRRRAN